jgi:hypothetical protein
MFPAGEVEPARAAIGRAFVDVDTARIEPVGAFPPGDLAKSRAARCNPLVKGGSPQAPGGLVLATRPRNAEQPARQLGRSLRDPPGIGHHARIASNVEVRYVERGFSVDDPLGQGLAGAARQGDARRVEAGKDVRPAHARRRANHEQAIGREAFRAGEQQLDPGFLEGRVSMNRAFDVRAEMIPVFRQVGERQFVRQLCA